MYKFLRLATLLVGCSAASNAQPPPSDWSGDAGHDLRRTRLPLALHGERHLYVATTGSDGNAGSRDAPLRSIQRAADKATPGTTVHVAPGTYRENVNTTAHGTAAARVRYVSERKWGAKIIGAGTEAMWANRGDFTDIIGFDISGTGRLGIANHASHTLIAYNHVHRLGISGGCGGNGGAGIVNGNYSASDGHIVGNVVHDIGVPGMCNHIHGIYSSNPGGRIYNNVVYRAAAYGIHLWHAATNVLVANNTVFANGAAGVGGGILMGTGDKPGGVILNHTKVINNIVFNNPAASIRQYCYPGRECIGASNLVANNLVYGNGNGITLRVGKAIGTIAADPQFVHYQADGSGDLRLKPSSPAIGKGMLPYAPSIDIAGAVRPRGAPPDIGAYAAHTRLIEPRN